MNRKWLISIAAAFVAIVAIVTTVALVIAFTQASDGIRDAPPIDGCNEVEAKELYVQRAYECQDGTRVVTFADDSARDDYLRTAEHFGAVTVDRGNGWARVR